MKKLRLYTLWLIVLTISLYARVDLGNGFWLEDNGVTVTCESASVGDTSTIENGGKLYTKIDSKDDLTTEGGAVAPTNACTSGVTNMGV